jgi:hypothetical protein
VQKPRRHKAFISHAHGDERWARWLQRALEHYKLPKSLRTAHPEMPARLFPIFRDRTRGPVRSSGGDKLEFRIVPWLESPNNRVGLEIQYSEFLHKPSV